LNLINTDTYSNPIQKSLIANNKNPDLNNTINSKDILSPIQKNPTAKLNNGQVSENDVTTKESFRTLEVTKDLPELEGNVTAVVSKVKYTATEGRTCRKNEHPDRHCQ